MSHQIKKEIAMLGKQIQTSPHLGNHHPQEQTRFDLLISDLARKVIATPLTEVKRSKRLAELRTLREKILVHVPVLGLSKQYNLFLNTIQTVAPSPICPAYSRMYVPTLSTYNEIGTNIGVIRCDPQAIKCVPQPVLETLGNLSSSHVDLLWTAIDIRYLMKQEKPFHLCSHPWTHCNALDKAEVRKHPNMGIFAEVGIEYGHPKTDHTYVVAGEKGGYEAYDPISLNSLKPLEVYTHLHRGSMAYSPPNAYFNITQGSPFALFWIVLRDGDRVCITKTLAIADSEHPISHALMDAIKGSNTLHCHLERLRAVDKAIVENFAPVIQQVRAGNIEIFEGLPLGFKHGIYKQVWLIAQPKDGTHPDFGAAAFHHDPSLDPTFYFNNEQKAQAIAQFADFLKEILIDSQVELLSSSQSLIKGDNVVKMMKCAQLIREKGMVALDTYHAGFSVEEKNATHSAVWELCGSPLGNDQFGENEFFSNHDFPLKANAVLLAASRMTPLFYQELPVTDLLEEEIPQIVTTTTTVPDVQPATISLSAEEAILNQCSQLVFSDAFKENPSSERARIINALLNQLGINTRNRIHGFIYENSQDPNKGGDSWGEYHVADDINLLVNALIDVERQ